MEAFISFNIYFIPRDKNKKEDSLALAASFSNPDDIQSETYFQVKEYFNPQCQLIKSISKCLKMMRT
jgi:hypothetical protein